MIGPKPTLSLRNQFHWEWGPESQGVQNAVSKHLLFADFDFLTVDFLSLALTKSQILFIKNYDIGQNLNTILRCCFLGYYLKIQPCGET